MSLRLLNSATGGPVDLTSEQAMAVYTNTTGAPQLVVVSTVLGNLNPAAATITRRLSSALSGSPPAEVAELDRVAEYKGALASHKGRLLGPALVQPSETLAVYVQSSNASDTAASLVAAVYDATESILIGRALTGHPRIWYVSPTGNDGNDGLTPETAKRSPKTAIEGASAGDLVIVGPGSYDMGTDTIEVPAGVKVVGRGRAEIHSSGLSHFSPLIVLNANCTLEDLILANAITDGVCLSTAFAPVSGIFVRRCHIRAEIDGFLNGGSVSARFEDCRIESNFDAVAVGSGSELKFLRCQLIAAGPSSFSTTAQALSAGSSKVHLYDCDLIATNTSSSGTAKTNAVWCNGGEVRLFGCRLFTSAAAGAVLDIKNDGGTVTVAQSSYDPARTSGDIVQIDTPGNVTGKVLGRGAATIIGTGVAADLTAVAGSSTIDGVSLSSLLETLLAFHAGKTKLIANSDGTKTLTVYKQDGTTPKLRITFNASGEWTATAIDPS